MKTFEYRLYPSKIQKKRLMECLIQSRLLYNEMLELSKAHYAETGKFLMKYDLSKRFKGRSGEFVPASTVCSLADRLDKAFRAFFRRKAAGKKGGFPRYKHPNRWHSIRLRQHIIDFRMGEKHITVPKKLGLSIKIKYSRPIEGMPKTCSLILRADNHWYALITCEEETNSLCELSKHCESAGHGEIGIDVGLKSFLTDSDGNTVDNPRYYQKVQRTLRIKQRKLCRRKKGSHRRRKAARCTAKTHLKTSRQRRDFHFKVAKKYADNFALIAIENLNIGGMLHNNLAKSISDAGWGQFISILKDKAERAGHSIVEVNPAYTTQECFRCGELVQKSLSVRTHICPHCGYIADRDVNAARNILKKAKAGARPSGTVDNSQPDEPRSPCY